MLLICDECGKSFNRDIIDYRTKHTFCCNKCSRIYNGRHRTKNIVTKLCLNCNTTVKTNKHLFCSHSCAATFNNKKFPKRKLKINYCITCNTPHYRKSKFCSIPCKIEYKYSQYINKWKSGEVDGLNGGVGISHYLRKYLFIKFDSKCSMCGWNKINSYTGKIPLTVEHKDGNYANNNESNLDLLCPCCHSLTATYGSLNKGKGRPRYNKGG